MPEVKTTNGLCSMCIKEKLMLLQNTNTVRRLKADQDDRYPQQSHVCAMFPIGRVCKGDNRHHHREARGEA
jgi:hypothetical protein